MLNKNIREHSQGVSWWLPTLLWQAEARKPWSDPPAPTVPLPPLSATTSFPKWCSSITLSHLIHKHHPLKVPLILWTSVSMPTCSSHTH